MRVTAQPLRRWVEGGLVQNVKYAAYSNTHTPSPSVHATTRLSQVMTLMSFCSKLKADRQRYSLCVNTCIPPVLFMIHLSEVSFIFHVFLFAFKLH